MRRQSNQGSRPSTTKLSQLSSITESSGKFVRLMATKMSIKYTVLLKEQSSQTWFSSGGPPPQASHQLPKRLQKRLTTYTSTMKNLEGRGTAKQSRTSQITLYSTVQVPLICVQLLIVSLSTRNKLKCFSTTSWNLNISMTQNLLRMR